MKKFFSKLKKMFLKIFTEPWFLYDPDFEIAKEEWRVHKFDADQNFPSVPHMDCVTDRRKKIDVYTGEIFLKKNKIGIIGKKDYERLWNDYDFRKTVYIVRKRYKNEYGKEYGKDVPKQFKEEYEKFINK